MTRSSMVLGASAGIVAAALLALPVATAVQRLWSARQIGADLAARIAAPMPPSRPLLAPGLSLRARDRPTAERMLADRIRGAAGAAGVLVEALVPAPRQPGIVAFRIRLSGPEKAMIALIDEIERGTPLVRFRAWRASALADGGMRVEGEVVGGWN